jgi:predicted transcriptional regulator
MRNINFNSMTQKCQLESYRVSCYRISKFMIREEFSMASSKTESEIGLAADIVAAYVSHNSVPSGDLAALISSVHATLTKLGADTAAPEAEALVPAVAIKKSVTPGYIICLDDGKRFKSLKRHLATHGMTADEYRLKWNLPKDYPMVAPEYAAKRSALAKSLGLGLLRKDRKSGRKPKAVTEKAAS